MQIDKETNEKMQELQILEQNFQGIAMQKQALQIDESESKTALEELGKAKGEVFRVLGQIIIKSDKETLKKELEERLKLVGIKLKTVEKHELEIREEIERIRGEIMEKIK